MNTMKILMAGVLVLLASGKCIAQEEKHGPDHKPHGQHEKMTVEERAEQKTKRMAEQLELTEAQQKDVNEMNIRYFKEMDEMRAEKRAYMKKMMEEKKAHKAEMKKKMKEQKDQMKGELDSLLTDEQKKKRDELRSKNCPCCDHHK